MKNKSTLLLLEIGIMLLVFALGSALCLNLFTHADNISQSSYNLDTASRHAQNIAEVLKSTHGDFEKAADILGIEYSASAFQIGFDKNWTVCNSDPHFLISVFGLCSDTEEMCQAKITVTEKGKSSPLFTIAASWQRGVYNE